jgi:hypothetical protein
VIDPERAAVEPPAAASIWPTWRTILAVAVALLAAGIALQQLQGLLQGMHLSGRPARSIGNLNHLLNLGADVKVSSSTVAVWKEYSDATAGQGTADGLEVAWWAVLVDAALFAPLYALGLFLFFLRAHRQLSHWLENRATPTAVKVRLRRAGHVESLVARTQGQAALRRYIRTAKIGMGLIVGALIADEAENFANIAIVKTGWHAEPDLHRLQSLTWLLWTAGWAKWVLALLAVALALALAWVVLAESFETLGAGWAALRPRLHLLRVQVFLAALVAILPFAHEQLGDMIRRWTVWQLALTGIAVWIFALSTWVVGRRLLCHGSWDTGWDQDREATIGRWLFWSLIALAAAQTGLHLAFRGSYRLGWGLVVPASILAGLALLGWLLPDAVPRDDADPEPPLSGDDPRPALPRVLAALAMAGFGLSVLNASFGYSVYAMAWTWDATRLIALGLVVAGALAAARAGREPLVGGLAGAIAGLALLAVAQSGELAPPILVVSGVLLVIAGWRLFGALGGAWLPEVNLLRMLVLAAAFAVCYAVIVVRPLQTGEALGGVAILLLFMTVVAWAGGLVVWVTPAIPVPQALRAAHVRRFPVVALLIVWFLTASWFDGGSYHNVRLKDAQAEARGVTLDEAFNCWLRKNGLKKDGCKLDTPASGEQAKATPLIFVATTGGGIRAAYWTDLVLDCAFEVPVSGVACDGKHVAALTRSDRLFALSGISGGSLGLASYAAYLAQKQAGPPEPGWVPDRLGGDALAGSGAWWLFVEIPRVFLQFRSPTDRAAILERGWEKEWPHGELGKGLLELWRTDRHTPLLLLNGTSVEDGCRFETSPLDANVETIRGIPPGCKSTEPFDPSQSGDSGVLTANVAHRSTLPATRDLVDLLCRDTKDVRLSTAALLSGRFPFVNPSARVEGRCKTYKTSKPVAYVVDGGYLDTSGASPVVEVMSRLQPLVDRWNKNHPKRCVEPVMIQIDNGFSAGVAGAAKRTGELLVPLKTVFATRGAREAESRVGAALLFGGQNPRRWAHFVNEAHPGPKAPLGWTQSKVSESELTSQLTQQRNKEAFGAVENWLSGGITCPATP